MTPSIKKLLHYQTFYQLIKYGIVGGIAATVNYLVVVLLVELFQLHPLEANIIGFIMGFFVSFFGHRYWTFYDYTHQAALALERFILIAIFNLTYSETLFYVLLHYAQIYYSVALLYVVLTVPIITFTLSKMWGLKTHA